ncbi:carbohydrate kinase family protein [Proteiniclasticum sp. QWL-01]|uniref:carbohydrate kinase family protein n=1 Tax=Proteiniclasticum sp. QWL-01 TaxID=3036945 RepID=UPI0022032A56|nr:carbohydrate kinase family protein [Proteiniclasticum sp. QWL-01]UUM11230.1 carbohydrate kinase family protein [Clostridiaceae bacterium HFYG-1003]WFF72568.1 carbohydrate kinase family protein [Proteiniclasticum sp. QWL-01]
MADILVMGGASYDTIIQLPKNPVTKGTYYAKDAYDRCGSTGIAKAVALQKLGASVTLHTLLGEDLEGQAITKHLRQCGIHLVTDPDPSGTELHFNLLDEEGERITILLPRGRDHRRINEVRLRRLIADAQLVVLNILEYNQPLIPLLEGKEVWTDLQDYVEQDPYYTPFIEASQVIFLSSDRLTDYRATMRRLGQGGKLIVATHGKEGSTAFWNHRFYEQSAHDFHLVDSEGAGDNYFAGFLVEYLKKQNLERSLMMASVAGGLSIETKELVPSDLTYDMLVSTMIRKGIR